MEKYLAIYNGKNKVQIDDSTKRLRFVRSALLSECGVVTEDEFNGNGERYNFDTNMEHCISINVFLENNESLMSVRIIDDNFSNGYVSVHVSRWKQNLYKIWIYSVYSANTSPNELRTIYMPKIKCYFWGEGKLSQDSFGLVVYDEQGETIFHSNDYVMDIQGKFSAIIKVQSDHRDYPTFNTGISNKKSLLIENMILGFAMFRGHRTNFGWASSGLYTQNGIYKTYSLYMEDWYNGHNPYWKDVFNPLAQNLQHLFYIIDVPD